MTKTNHSSQVTVASGINILLGIWLIMSPFSSGYAAAPVYLTYNNVIVGILIVMCAATRYFSPAKRISLSGINIFLGIWTLISPWIYNYGADASLFWTNIVAGIIVIALALWSGSVTYVDRRQQHHA